MLLECDLLAEGGPQAIIEQAQATHLVHLAWFTAPGAYWDSVENNRWSDASENLICAFCGAGGRHVAIAGSCAEYGIAASACREMETPAAPDSEYGRAKHRLHQISREVCAAHSCGLAWCRIFFPYGPGEAKEKLVSSLIAAFHGERDPFGVAQDQMRDFVHASDLGEAFAALVDAGADGTFNVCTGAPVAIGELVRTVAGLLHADPSIVLNLDPPAIRQQPLLTGDNSGLRTLGWAPRVSLADGLQELCRKYQPGP